MQTKPHVGNVKNSTTVTRECLSNEVESQYANVLSEFR